MASMTPAERSHAAFEKQATDVLPIHHVGFSSYAAQIILGREAYVGGGIQKWRESTALWQGPDAHAEFIERTRRDAIDVCLATNCDMVRTGYWRLTEKPTKRIDENTFLFGDPDGDYVVRKFDPETELYSEIDQNPPPRHATPEEMAAHVDAMEQRLEQGPPPVESFEEGLAAYKRLKGEYAVCGNGTWTGLPHEAAWLEAIALYPELVARRLEAQLQGCLLALETQKDLPFVYLKGGGDFAADHGPFYSPRSFRELVLPRLRAYNERAEAYGKYSVFASDGNLWPVADALFGESGLHGFFEIDRRAGMDLRKLRERFPQLTLIGNLSSHTLHLGTRDEVIAECRDAAETAMELRGIIVGLSNYPLPGTPPENITAMLDTLNEYR